MNSATPYNPVLLLTNTGMKKTYYRIDFQIALLFGLTEFRAMVIWKDSDVSD